MSDDIKQDAPLGIDGKLWAEAFCKLHPTVDVSDALGWFCNAIMAGYDEGSRRTWDAVSEFHQKATDAIKELSDVD